MNRIAATTVEKNLSGLIEDVKNGECFLITQRGKPVAEIIPHVPDHILKKEKVQAIKRLKKFLESGVSLGGEKFNREELYDR